MNDNIIPFNNNKTKADRFAVFLADHDDKGQVIEKERVGLAFMKVGAKAFRLKLWQWLGTQYFVVPDQRDQTKYTIFSLEEYLTEKRELKSYWNKIGEGDYYGNYIRLKFYLMDKELYVSLFPENIEAHEIYNTTEGGNAA